MLFGGLYLYWKWRNLNWLIKQECRFSWIRGWFSEENSSKSATSWPVYAHEINTWFILLWPEFIIILVYQPERSKKRETLIWLSFALKTNPIYGSRLKPCRKLHLIRFISRYPICFRLNIAYTLIFAMVETYNTKHNRLHIPKQNSVTYEMPWATERNPICLEIMRGTEKSNKRRLQRLRVRCWFCSKRANASIHAQHKSRTANWKLLQLIRHVLAGEKNKKMVAIEINMSCTPFSLSSNYNNSNEMDKTLVLSQQHCWQFKWEKLLHLTFLWWHINLLKKQIWIKCTHTHTICCWKRRHTDDSEIY